MTLKEAINAVLTILKQVMEEKLNSTNVEVVTVTPGKLFHMFTKEEVEAVSYLYKCLNNCYLECKRYKMCPGSETEQ